MRSYCVPSFSWKTISFSFGTQISRLDLAVLIEEEFGVGEPRADHPLIAGDDGLAAVGRFQIRH